MQWLLERIRARGATPFLADPEGTCSYGELAAATETAGRNLVGHGIAPGDPVALLGSYSLTSIASFLALAAAKAVVVPVSTNVEDELDARCREAGARWIVDARTPACTVQRVATGSSKEAPLLGRLRERRRAGLVLFSSGSSGRPKAMLHDLDTLVDSYADRRLRQLTMLVVLMFDHIGGINTLLNALSGGLKLVVPAARTPEAIAEAIAAHGATVLPASPTFLNLLLLSGATRSHDLSSLRIVTYGTEPMPPALLERLRSALPRVKFVQTFGTSETGIAQTVSASSGSTLMKLDDPNLEYRVEDGELWLRSRTQILGYLNHPMDSFTADGWFRTGDLVEQRDDGFLRIIGRRSEAINVGGLKVLPSEVESVLMEMPQITDCVVRGEPNAITGSIVVAEVVLAQPEDAPPIKTAIRQHCRTRLDAYKVPVKVRIVETILRSERLKKVRAPTPSTGQHKTGEPGQ